MTEARLRDLQQFRIESQDRERGQRSFSSKRSRRGRAACEWYRTIATATHKVFVQIQQQSGEDTITTDNDADGDNDNNAVEV